MTCDMIVALLEEYLDGEASAADAVEIDAHLDRCLACQSARIALQREALFYRRVEPRMDVPAGLWDAIAKEIAPAPVPGPAGSRVSRMLSAIGLYGWQATGWATAGIAAVVLAVGIVNSIRQPGSGLDGGVAKTLGWPALVGPGVAGDDGGGAILPANDAGGTTINAKSQQRRFTSARPAERDSTEIALIDARYGEAISLLDREVSAQTQRLPRREQDRITEPIRHIDRSISEAREIARKDPNDPNAVLGLVSAYEKKLEVLQDIASYRAVTAE